MNGDNSTDFWLRELYTGRHRRTGRVQCGYRVNRDHPARHATPKPVTT